MSLFLKIFLWFWGMMALMGLALLLIQFTTQDVLVVPPRRTLAPEALGAYGWEAVKVYRTSGKPGLSKYLQRLEKRTKVRAYLFGPHGEELGPRSAPPEVRDLQEKARQDSLLHNEDNATLALLTADIAAAQPVPTKDGVYVLAGTLRRSLLTATQAKWETRLLRVATVFTLTGFVCFALARYLAAPVSKVRRTAQQIAAGDLSARVSHGRPMRGRDEISALARDFDRMADRLETVVTAQQRLLGDVSHELRSPLARLNLALELAKRGDAEKQTAAMERIGRESGRLEALIDELLTLSKLESGLRATKTEVDLSALCAEVAGDADFEAGRRECRVEFETSLPTAPVEGDREMLRRAVENITRNAIRHTAPASTVALSLTREDNTYLLAVHDHGDGVPEEELEAIFRPFYRVDSARERAPGEAGTGLGLAIAQRAVRAHGGDIRARNAAGGGLIVEIRLPMG